MEKRVRTGSGFRAQGVVERKFPNRNPDVTDWFWLEESSSGNFARNRLGTLQQFARIGTFREQEDREHI